MLPWLVLSLLLGAGAAWCFCDPSPLRQRLFLWGALLCCILLAGCRGASVGNDTAMYLRHYGRLEGLSSFGLLAERFEPGYRLFCCILAEFFPGEGHALLFVSALLTCGACFRLFWRRSQKPVISALLFVSLLFYSDSLCLLRQYLAVAAACVALDRLGRRQTGAFLVLTALAYSFHRSALILLLLLPLVRLRLDRRNRLLLTAGAFGAALCIRPFLGLLLKLLPQYARYLDSDYFLQNKAGTLLKFLVYFLFFLLVEQGFPKEEEVQDWNKLEFSCALLAAAVQLAAREGAVLSRMGIYFALCSCVSLPNALSRLQRRELRLKLELVLLGCCLCYQWVILLLRPHWAGVIPYEFWV